ncbi:DinB family protein [Chloroflexota bacterium]
MEAKEVIVRSLEESQGRLTKALDGLTQEEIASSPKEECNSIAFILWHMTRAEDMWINSAIRHQSEVYEVEGWRTKLGTPMKDTGGKYTRRQLQAWPVPDLENLRGYSEAVRDKTNVFLESIDDNKLSEVARTDPSTDTVGAILGHLITEIAMHVGQIDYLHGLHRGLDSATYRYWR